VLERCYRLGQGTRAGSPKKQCRRYVAGRPPALEWYHWSLWQQDNFCVLRLAEFVALGDRSVASKMVVGNMSTHQTIFIVDDDEGMRDSLRALLISATYEVRDYPSALAFLDENITIGGCLIADVLMPEMTGWELQTEVVRRAIALPVIFITGKADVSLAVRAMKAGAIDFIQKPFKTEALLASVKLALKIGAAGRDRSVESKQAVELLYTLTPRERQVLDQLVAGRSNKIAAYELSISPRTIEVHRAHVMDKLHASSMADLVRTSLAASLPH
jgi:two-component system response regulator FixJ